MSDKDQDLNVQVIPSPDESRDEKRQFDIYPEEVESVEEEETKKNGYWHDMMAVVTSGCAFMSDGYQQGIMTMANVALKASYKEYDSTWSTRVSNAVLVGNIIGQIGFGLIVDRIGRRQGFALTTFLIVLGAALAAGASGSTIYGQLWMLSIARGVLGVGVGGEYPASASSAIEASDERLGQKGRVIPFIMASNLPVALGVPVSTSVFLIVLSICGKNHLNAVWRACFAIGAIIPLSIFYFRWRMFHAKVFRKNAIKRNVPYLLMVKKYWKNILGTAGMWFIMDFVLYPNNIFSASVISAAIPGASVRKTAEWQLLLSSFAILGVFIGAFATKWLTRRQINISGFLIYAVFSFIVGGSYPQMEKIVPLFVIFYGLMNASINYGPANLQSLVTAEAFPTALRGTLYGFGAAVGKAGAAIGTTVFLPISNHAGKRYTFIVSGAVCIIGALVVYFFVPDHGEKDLSEIDNDWNEYLVEHGWDGMVGDSERHALKEPSKSSVSV